MRTLFQHAGAVGSLGSALIVIAVGAGSPFWPALLLVLAGIYQIILGVAVFQQRDWTTRPGALLTGISPLVIWLMTVITSTAGSMPLVPMLAASLLTVLSVVSIHLQPREETRTEPGAGRFLLILIGVSAAVSAVVTPALAGTAAGAQATPHGEHTLFDQDHH